MKTLKYNTKKYNFAEIIAKCLGVLELDKAHSKKQWDLVNRENDQQSPYHKLYYNNFHGSVQSIWESFVQEIIAPTIQEDILYQTIPTFRVQIPGNLAVGEFHRDSKYGHQDGAINIYLPFTDVNPYNTIHVESSPGKEDYKPILCKYGEVVLWDGVNLKHGNLINKSEKTRISVDARILPVSKYVESNSCSINVKVPLKEGGYYTRLNRVIK